LPFRSDHEPEQPSYGRKYYRIYQKKHPNISVGTVYKVWTLLWKTSAEKGENGEGAYAI
jgi:hypothetical protein